jgi:hypothetical protein
MKKLFPAHWPRAAMRVVTLACAGLPFAGQATEASAAAKLEVPEAAIPFADHGGINNWEADGNRGLWVQSSHNKWYYGTFAAPCFGLQFHETLKFRFSPSGSLDRYSQIETRDPGGNCWFKSFTASEGPPKADKGKAGKAKDQAKGQDKDQGKGVGTAPATGGP